MKKIILLILIVIPVNIFPQSSASFVEFLCDSITNMATKDMENYLNIDSLIFGDNNNEDNYYRESIAIMFNSEEYDEFSVNSSDKQDELKYNIVRRKTSTLIKLKQIYQAMVENKIRDDLFDCFLYKISYKDDITSFEAEYKIKIIDSTFKIINKKVSFDINNVFAKTD